MSQPKKRRSWGRWIGLVLVLVLIAGAVVVVPRFLQRRAARQANAAQVQTGTVTTVTAISSVESSGSTAARQSTSVNWQTTGQVAEVAVKVGDHVTQGQSLMTLDMGSASAQVIQAQSDLLDAQKALNDLLHPSALSIVNAQQAVVDAQTKLDQLEKELRGLENPDVSYYADQLAQKQAALVTAQQNAEKNNIGSLTTALANAQKDLDTKTNHYNDAKSAQERCPGCTVVFVNSAGRPMSLEQAEQEYNDAVNAYRVAELNVQQGQASSQDAIDAAQDAVNDAQANLAAAKAGPNAEDLAAKQASVALAQANLTDAQQKLDRLQNGADPDDIRKAELRKQAVQVTLDALTLRAPIAGEVLVINNLPGDRVSPTDTAVVIADRSQLHVNAAVDESDIHQVALGQPVALTFDAVPGVTLSGTVAYINPLGATSQGLVKYTVRVDVLTTDPGVLLGMTANVRIITAVRAGALAVPLDAVQLDDDGEFVTRVSALGIAERVDVVSGDVLDAASAGAATDLVIVTGDLRPGDTVQLVAAVPTSGLGGPFGGGRGGP